ncbi:hypothetical protein GVN16_23100 [Emticicia sp. CRIBPO]|uniref:hypothetical protein n=1 Tax=Emticicia sp. CRIBPO TaxID=2683258 RepID=UPI001411DE28|nr:hypothetical protein [Emticicia sp. CRIBPO]NBA88680.1 hypothetical protein [Emticicia sp. CRIBPO]
MRNLFVLALVYLSLASCNGIPKTVTTFKIVRIEVNGVDITSDINSALSTDFDHSNKSLLSESHIKFNDNDTVTVLSPNGIFSYGKYQFKTKDLLILNLNGLGDLFLDITRKQNDRGEFEQLTLTGFPDKKHEMKLFLVIDDYYKSGKRDLLSLEENKWRLRPKNRENQEQIKKRVIGQLDYMIGYFSLIDEKKYSSFTLSHLNSPFSFYNNGIGINPYPSDRYDRIFFDTNDADKAVKMLSAGVKSIRKYPSDPKSFTKGYKNALEEIKRYVKSH